MNDTDWTDNLLPYKRLGEHEQAAGTMAYD